MDYNDYGWGVIAFWLAVAPILFLLAIAAYVVGSFFLMKVFDKAAPSQRPVVMPTPEMQRTRDRAAPAPVR